MISLPKGVNLNQLIQFLRNIGLQSSALLRDFENQSTSLYDSLENFHHDKKNNDPVTIADLALNTLILEAFANKYPNTDWDIITEENSKIIAFEKPKSDWIWSIDPLDGTKDFIQRTGEYAVHVALIFKGNPILSMVLLPRLKEIWFGVLGIGTWKEGEESVLENKEINLEKLEKKELKPSMQREITNVVTSKNHNNPKLELILNEMNFQNVIRMGSIGFKVCSLLRKEAEIYISISGKTSPKDWDLAAPNALMKSAKCNFTYVNEDEIKYGKKNYEQKGCLIASTLYRSEHVNVCRKINLIIKKYNLL